MNASRDVYGCVVLVQLCSLLNATQATSHLIASMLHTHTHAHTHEHSVLS
jgi:hypothetical protein